MFGFVAALGMKTKLPTYPLWESSQLVVHWDLFEIYGGGCLNGDLVLG